MNCVHCGKPLPEGSRRDRAYCDHKCRALASCHRRKAGIRPPPRWAHPALTSDNPALRSAAALAKQLGEANGWSPSLVLCAMDGLTAVLEHRPPGKPVKLTEVRTRIPRHASSFRVAEVLADLELLEDDSASAIRSWIDDRTGELPASFASDVRAWQHLPQRRSPAPPDRQHHRQRPDPLDQPGPPHLLRGRPRLTLTDHAGPADLTAGGTSRVKAPRAAANTATCPGVRSRPAASSAAVRRVGTPRVRQCAQKPCSTVPRTAQVEESAGHAGPKR
jgi:hypothetical protein